MADGFPSDDATEATGPDRASAAPVVVMGCEGVGKAGNGEEELPEALTSVLLAEAIRTARG